LKALNLATTIPVAAAAPSVPAKVRSQEGAVAAPR